MRLPVTPQLSTKDGVSNKNARLTNTLKTTSATGEIAEVRPGLVTQDTYTGLGTGLIAFDGRLLAVYDDLIYSDEEFSWDLDAPEWDALAAYDINDQVWYDGVFWFSANALNLGNLPGPASTWWVRWIVLYTWKEDEEYDIGDSVRYGGTTYYSWRDGNVGNTPQSSPLDWRTTAPNSNYTISNIVYTPPYPKPFPGTTSATWNIMDGAVVVGVGSGTYTSSYDSESRIASAIASNWPNDEPTTGFTRPSPPPGTVFSGSTQWSGLPGWINYGWFPAQSSGAWYAVG
jgi:hypothetical protein